VGGQGVFGHHRLGHSALKLDDTTIMVTAVAPGRFNITLNDLYLVVVNVSPWLAMAATADNHLPAYYEEPFPSTRDRPEGMEG